MPDAISHVGSLKLSPSAKNSAEWLMVEPAVRATSFFSACVEDERVLGGLQKLVQQAMEEGMSMQDFVAEALSMLEFIKLEPPQGDEEKKAFRYSIDTLYNPERLRLIYRTQEQLANGYARVCEAFEPDWLNMFPAWMFVRVDGAKEDQKRPDHVKHENAIRLKSDIQFWLDRNSFDQGGFGNPYGPWGFNSWMQTFDVDRETAEALGLLQPGETVEAPKELAEWGLAHVLQQVGTASTKGLSVEAVERVVERCEQEGVPVQEQDGALQVSSEAGPIGELSDAAFDAWMDDILDF